MPEGSFGEKIASILHIKKKPQAGPTNMVNGQHDHLFPNDPIQESSKTTQQASTAPPINHDDHVVTGYESTTTPAELVVPSTQEKPASMTQSQGTIATSPEQSSVPHTPTVGVEKPQKVALAAD